jgi:hypothetical protein
MQVYTYLKMDYYIQKVWSQCQTILDEPDPQLYIDIYGLGTNKW